MDPEEKNLDYFLARFNELASDAQEHGLSTATIILNDDPIAKQVGIVKVYRGSPPTLAGLLYMALKEF